MELLIDNRQDKIDIGEEVNDLIEKVVVACLQLENESLDYEISLSFVDDEEIRVLNRDFRGKDCATDVLSFPMEEDDFQDFMEEDYIPLLGDIVISAERALLQAQDFGHSLEREIAYLTAHSMFHLMGYDHMNDDEKAVMRDKEKSVMKDLGIFK